MSDATQDGDGTTAQFTHDMCRVCGVGRENAHAIRPFPDDGAGKVRCLDCYVALLCDAGLSTIEARAFAATTAGITDSRDLEAVVGRAPGTVREVLRDVRTRDIDDGRLARIVNKAEFRR